MDAIRKKMQSMKAETDDLYRKIKEYEDATKEANDASDRNECDIRDMGKKVQKYETKMEEIMEQLTASGAKMDAAESEFKDKEEDVNAQSRRVLLLEQESTISEEKLATTVMKLALMSKEADNIVKDCRHWESKTMNNEVEIEELDKNTREARRIGTDNEMKYDNLARSLAMMEDELKRADERVKNAEARVEVIEAELTSIGENQKQLEISEEKARRREEMNISKLHLRIDELEDEIIREKLKINAVSGQLDDTFNEMLNKLILLLKFEIKTLIYNQKQLMKKCS